MTENEHKCYGCQKQIRDNEPHIHVGLDAWMKSKGMDDEFGLDDLLTFPVCSECTVQGGPFHVEAHEIEAT